MLALVVGVECFVAGRALDFTDGVALSWRFTADALPRETAGRDVLFLGDSLVKYGLIPKVVEKHSGLRGYNLAVGRCTPATTYFFLRRLLESGTRPPAVVIDFKPLMMTCPHSMNVRCWPEIVTLREALELARADADSSLVALYLTGRLLPTFRNRLEIRANLVAALRGERDRLAYVNRFCLRNWESNDGALVMSRNPAFTGAVSAKDMSDWHPDAVNPLPINLIYVERIFRLAARHGVRVYWLLPPMAPRFLECRESTGAEARYLKFVRSAQARYPGVTVLDARHSGYGVPQLFDLMHLNVRGALALSADVAEVLRRDQDQPPGPGNSPRWVDLPAPRDWPAEGGYEEMERSQAIVLRESDLAPKPLSPAAPGSAAPR